MDNTKISISTGNSKMGAIPSVSLTPIKTCVNCASCAKKCYAAKLCKIYPSVKAAYDRNLAIYENNASDYFSQVEKAAKMTRFFRWHVSGDILNISYFENMVKIAKSCKNTTFLAFTKNYPVVNEWIANNGKLPKNLKVLFSLPFDGAIIDNPNKLPQAAVILKGDEPKKGYKICGGNCAECASCGIGCWELKKGQTIAFYEH